MYVVEYYWHSVARGFSQPDISRNYGIKYLSPEKTSQVGRHLFGERRSVIVHRQKNSLDRERWINSTPDPHEGVQKFGNALNCQEFALNRDKH